MRKRTRIFAAIFSVLLVCTLFAACGESDPIVGEWKLKSVTMDGEEISLKDYLEIMDQKPDEIPVFKFEKNGTFTTENFDEGSDDEYKWESKDSSYTFRDAKDETFNGTLKGEELDVETEKGLNYLFERTK